MDVRRELKNVATAGAAGLLVGGPAFAATAASFTAVQSALKEMLKEERDVGLGEIQTQPGALPWDRPDPRRLAAEKRWETINKATTVIGLLGGAIGLVLSLRALKAAGKDK